MQRQYCLSVERRAAVEDRRTVASDVSELSANSEAAER